MFIFFFFFNDTATTEIYTLSLHDALPISDRVDDDVCTEPLGEPLEVDHDVVVLREVVGLGVGEAPRLLQPVLEVVDDDRSEEHTSELQSRQYLVCRLLLEKKKKKNSIIHR